MIMTKKYNILETIQTISKNSLLLNSSKDVYEKGATYQKDGSILKLTVRGNEISAEARGSFPEPYNVSICLNAQNYTVSCDCPYDWTNYCKHIVAVFLDASNGVNHYRYIIRPTVDKMLKNYTKKKLHLLIERMIYHHPYNTEIIDAIINGTENKLKTVQCVCENCYEYDGCDECYRCIIDYMH